MSELETGELGVVIIGRNEGQRLVRCLESIAGLGAPMVYVDSGSTDDSIAHACELGAVVIELDAALPFTAARARNAGVAELRRMARVQQTPLQQVQFIDGDCTLDPTWLEQASRALALDPQLAAVCGRRRERWPDRSVYNQLCDIEWDTPIGGAEACGGDALYCEAALAHVGDFDPALIAGEEPELCFRLRRAGWRIERLDLEMTCHDADMHHFSQWWRRAARSGYAYVNGAWLHGRVGRFNIRPVASILLWGGVLPLLSLLAVWLWGSQGLLGLAGYGVLSVRVYSNQRYRGARHARLLALFIPLAKFAELTGVLKFLGHRLLSQQGQIIEYKAKA